MQRKFPLIGTILLLVPVAALAKVDLNCPGVSATSAITGTVKNAKGQALAGMKVELYVTNRNVPTADSAVTDATGFYRVCAGAKSGSYYDTFDVHVREPDGATAPLYATANQPYTTYLNPAGNADFTPESGIPLLYMTNLTISPAAISTALGAANVSWTVRSKAPTSTELRLTLQHPAARAVVMTPATPEGGGPPAGGWNRWTYGESIAANSEQKLYLATARGFDGATEVTQRDVQPYVIDNTRVLFGEQTAAVCGDGVYANPFSPKPPLGTTNHRPIVTHDVCDPPSASGARSGPDAFSLRGWICPTPDTPVGSCTEINPVLNARTITWVAQNPLADGSYYFRWRIGDVAGNVSDSDPQWLKVGNTTGQVPFFTALSPGNFGSGATAGIIVGSSITSPSSFPVIGFRVVDADGPLDIVPGSLEVLVYYLDGPTLVPTKVYEYDPTMGKAQYDPVTKRGGADFDLSSGLFKATGFDLRGKPPGRYVCTASVTDHGGNNASVSWHFILVAAV